MAPALCTTIKRDGVDYDVTVTFEGVMTLPAARACWDDPGYPAEYEVWFVGAELTCPESPTDSLSESETKSMRRWFAVNLHTASDALADADVGTTP